MKDPRLAAYLERRIAEELDPRQALARDGHTVRGIVEWALESVAWRRPGELRLRIADREVNGIARTAIEVLAADQPFVVDTFRLNLRRLGLRERLHVHRLLAIERDDDGSIARLGPDDVRDVREVYLYAEVPLVADAERRDEIRAELERALENLRWVVSDHGRMLEQIRRHTADIERAAQLVPGGVECAPELRDFLGWIADDNYVFFGYRWYETSCRDGVWRVRTDAESGLGLMRATAGSRFLEPRVGDEIPELVHARLEDPRLVFFDKSRTTSRIHREGRLDCLSVKVLGEDGLVHGFGRFIGMLTHKAIQTRGSDLPILRDRRDRMLAEIGVEPGSHDYKAAIEAFDSLPLEFLFPFDLADITSVVQRVLHAGEAGDVAIAVVPDPLNRSFFVSVILARSRYDEELRQELRALLVEKYDANYVEDRSSFVDDEVALIHFFCTSVNDVDFGLLSQLENDVRERATGWDERFEAALRERHPEREAHRLSALYASAFPADYRAVTAASEAGEDVERLEALRSGEVRIELVAHPRSARLKLYRRERPYLTDLLPVLDNCGLRVLDAVLTELPNVAGESLWIVTCRMADDETGHGLDPRPIEGLRAVLGGAMEDGRLNRLILGAGLDWREVDLLRAYLAYAQQLGIAPQIRRAAAILLRYPEATRALVALFRARFDPEGPSDRDAAQREARERLGRARGPVHTADEDRVFALVEELIAATVRTSFFAAPLDVGHAIVLKMHPRRIGRAPSPRPYAEIFVHAADMSGVHLRGGPIARGGIRWSDRVGDFRTEVLGLVKTQMVKNGLIVPVGAKGGFVLKRRFDTRGQGRAEADRQYARFMRCLLSLTDNHLNGAVVPPEGVVRHDGNDPYLVVAPDKGTAHLSDVANRVAEESGYWLGDAFASGGSEGYDHKEVGITARGAWVCVRRHFLELGIDVERERFTIAGIGDMSGDVFGNFLLLARWGRLLAAFNHQHVFLDPDPDPELAWRERQRQFALPSSSWSDYDRGSISPGGGVFERDAKAISLAPAARAMLGIEVGTVSGEELVRAILRMRVDVLWNGGVGTYVKSSAEGHSDVGDRANDVVRIDASELCARVVAEGGNLGFTQLARVEFALAGGRIQTDAIDNSGGVDLSDREVNCKVLLAGRCAAGLMTREERNSALRECGDQVAGAVLLNNAAQSRSISLDLIRAARDARRIELAAEFLERHGGLDLALESLPEGDALRARMTDRQGYTRPEVAVLLGYTKILVKRELVESDLVLERAFGSVLAAYFPELLRERFAYEIAAHPLRREITATRLCNQVIDQAGVTLVPELCGALPVSVAEVITAYYTMDRLLEADAVRVAIESQPVDEKLRLDSALRLERSVREAARGLLGLERRACLGPDEFERRQTLVRRLREVVDATLDPVERERNERTAEALAGSGFDRELALRIERLSSLVRSLGALSIAADSSTPLARVVELHRRIGEDTRITWLCERLSRPDRRDRWDRVAAEHLQLEMLEVQRTLTARLLAADPSEPGVERFRSSERPALTRIDDVVSRIEAESPRGLGPLSVLAHHIRRIV